MTGATPIDAQRPGGAGANGPAASAGDGFRYAAFISYRHGGEDGDVAAWLHKAIEQYRLPRAVQRSLGLPARVGRIFRDEEELPTSASLSEQIETALAQSRAIIVVASPRLQESKWCRQEINRFVEIHERARVLVVLVSGDPRKRDTADDPFPPELRRAGSKKKGEDEPIAADLRPHPKRSRREVRRRTLVKLIAGLVGCNFDDLWLRDLRRRKQRAFLVAGLALIALVGVAVPTGLFLQSRGDVARARQATEEQKRQTQEQSQLKEAEQARASAEAERAKVEREHARAEGERAEFERLNQRWAQYVADMQTMSVAWKENDLLKARQILDRNVGQGADDLRGPEWYYWNQELGSTGLTLDVGGRVDALSFSPNGDAIAVVSEDALSVWSLTTKAAVFRTPVSLGIGKEGDNPAYFDCRLVFSPDGKWIGVAEMPGRSQSSGACIRVFEAASGKQLFVNKDKGLSGLSVAFGPGGVVVAGMFGCEWKAWQVTTGREAYSSQQIASKRMQAAPSLPLIAQKEPVSDLRFEGSLLIAGSIRSGVMVSEWDRQGPNLQSQVRLMEGNGLRVGAGAGEFGILRRSEDGFDTGPPIGGGTSPAARSRFIKGSDGARCAALDDECLVIGGADRVVRVWRLNGMQSDHAFFPPEEYRGIRGRIDRVARSRRGVAGADDSGVVTVWKYAETPDYVPPAVNLGRDGQEQSGPKFPSLSGKIFGQQPVGTHTLVFSDAKSGAEISRWEIEGGSAGHVVYSPSDRYALVLVSDLKGISRRALSESVRSQFTVLVDVRTGKDLCRFPVGMVPADMAFDEQEKIVLAKVFGEPVRLYAVQDGSLLDTIDGVIGQAARTSRSGRLVGVGGVDGWGVFDRTSRKWLIRDPSKAYGIAFDPGERHVAALVSPENGKLKVVELATGRPVPTAFGADVPSGIVFGADGLRAYASTEAGVDVFAITTGLKLATLPVKVNAFTDDVDAIESQLRAAYPSDKAAQEKK